jgi:hypothetical protein
MFGFRLSDGFSSDTVDLKLTAGVAKHNGLTLDLPIVSVDTLGESGYGIGDFSLKIAQVSGLSKRVRTSSRPSCFSTPSTAPNWAMARVS